MKRILIVLTGLLLATPAQATPDMTAVIGEPAPGFTINDALSGRTFQLSKLRGKPVVLEWNNFGCPFVKKHYRSGNMQKLQREAIAGGAHWITINSSAEGKQGYLKDAAAVKKAVKAYATAPEFYVRDTSGEIGLTYGAKVTPHMFVIDKNGLLRYAGAIDNKPTPHVEDIQTARNYVREALAALKARKPLKVTQTRAYGCGIKYFY